MPSLNDLWQRWLSGDMSPTTAAIQGRPTLVSVGGAAVIAPVLLGTTGQKRIYTYNVYNPNSSVAFLQMFSAASAGAVTLGTTAPLDWIAVPAGGVVDGVWDFSPAFTAGLVVAATTTPTGATAVTTGVSVSFGVL